MRMLLKIFIGLNANETAGKGNPICDRMRLIPMVRRKVVFPLILEPVINNTCCKPLISILFATVFLWKLRDERALLQLIVWTPTKVLDMCKQDD